MDEGGENVCVCVRDCQAQVRQKERKKETDEESESGRTNGLGAKTRKICNKRKIVSTFPIKNGKVIAIANNAFYSLTERNLISITIVAPHC